MASDYFFGDDFTAAVQLACVRARVKTLEAGIPVFYRDAARNIYVREQPDGRKHEICFTSGEPGEHSYHVLRELDERAA